MAPSAEHAATHSTQPVHSMERIVMSLSTGKVSGTGFGALRTIDAGFRGAADAGRAEESGES